VARKEMVPNCKGLHSESTTLNITFIVFNYFYRILKIYNLQKIVIILYII